MVLALLKGSTGDKFQQTLLMLDTENTVKPEEQRKTRNEIFEMTLLEVGKSYFPIMYAYQKQQLVYMQHYLKLGNYTVRNFATGLCELNNYLPYFPWEKDKPEPCKLLDAKLVTSSTRRSLKNGRRSFLEQILNCISLIFKVPLITLRNLKSDRCSRRNVVKTNALIILVRIRIRAIGIRTNPKRPNNILSTRNVRIAVVQTM